MPEEDNTLNHIKNLAPKLTANKQDAEAFADFARRTLDTSFLDDPEIDAVFDEADEAEESES